MMLIQLAWRSLWRNWRRTLIAMSAVIFAITLSIIQRGIQYGTYSETIKTAVRLSTGYLQIQREGYNKSPTLQKSFIEADAIRKALDSSPYIDGSSPRIESDALLSFRDQSLGVLIMGIKPNTESSVTDFSKKIRKGRFLSPDSALSAEPVAEIVVGDKLLKNLGAQVGDSVVALAQGFDGILGNMFARIVGTFATGSNEFDRMGVFMNINELQNFLNMGDRINAIAVSVRDPNELNAVVLHLDRILKPEGLVALPWQEMLPQLRQMIELDDSSGVLYIIVLLFVVGFGILNTVLMSITERFREYGVMLALGMSEKKLAATVALEIFFMLVIGFVAGNCIGVAVNSYLVSHPIMLGGSLAQLYQEYGFAPTLKSSLSFKVFLDSSLTILGISIVAAVYPLWRVLRLEPLKGIRYT